MKKNNSLISRSFLILVLLIQSSTSYTLASGSSNKKDYHFDSRTSTMIPNFAGKIMFKRGDVFITKKDGTKIKTFKDTKLYQHQIIITSSKSIAKIKLVDQTVLTIGANSKLKIDKFIFRTDSDRDCVISLLRGKLRSHFRVKSKRKNQLQVNIKNVSLGIRGTKVLASINQDSMEIALLEGSANLNNNTTGSTYDLNSKDYFSKNKIRKLTKREIANLRDGEREDLNNFLPFLNIAKTRKTHQKRIHEQLKKADKKYNNSSSKWKNNLLKLNQKMNTNETD